MAVEPSPSASSHAIEQIPGETSSVPAPSASVPAEPSATPPVASAAPSPPLGRGCGEAAPPKKKLLGHPKRAIPELAHDKVTSGEFDIEGVVMEAFTPQPCPPKAMCKPQPPTHLLVAPKDAPDATLFVIVADAKAFKVQKSYAMSISICGSVNSHHVNDAELEAFEPR